MRTCVHVCVCACYLNTFWYLFLQYPAQINIGRIAALLGYCYSLCMTYISKNMAAGSLLSFIAMVAGWLFKFLIKAKFYEWLERQGGWVSDHNSPNLD